MLGARKVDWADEQASRTDEFQQELQAKTKAMSDLNAEKVGTSNGRSPSKLGVVFDKKSFSFATHVHSHISMRSECQSLVKSSPTLYGLVWKAFTLGGGVIVTVESKYTPWY